MDDLNAANCISLKTNLANLAYSYILLSQFELEIRTRTNLLFAKYLEGKS